MSLIGDILPVSNILPDLDVSSKKRAFEEIGLLLENQYGLPRNNVFECLFAREKLGSTGLGQGVAIPHGRSADVKETFGVFVRIKEAIAFDAPDGKPVNMIFTLIVPENATGKHLEVLSELADIFSSKEARERILQATTAEEIHSVFVE